ncbi:MAG: hypothetical protein KAS72_02305 [Phycisphaerales bacterium]|nr:hypothetical protein [Phycisphaerales bacterium]
MHVLTKIFVVFVSFLSVLLVSLTVAYASNAGTLVNKVEGLQSRVQGLNTELADANAQESVELGRIELQRDQQENLVREREQEILEIRGREADYNRRVAEAGQEIERLQAQITQFASAIQTQAKLVDQLTEETNRRRESELSLERQAIELQDRINDLESQLEVARAHEQQLKERIANMEQGEEGDDRLPPLPPTLFGNITSIQETNSGEQFVEVNLGSSDGLRVNHELRVVRDGQYVATIKIIRVDVNRAAGQIVSAARGMQIRVNDGVQSALTQ